MKCSKRKGYVVERKVRMFFQRHGWATIKSGGSLGLVDVVCLKKGRCILMQVKSTKKTTLYAVEKISHEIQGFPLYFVVDFGYGNIRVFKSSERMDRKGGMTLSEFVKWLENMEKDFLM